jgi:hypothetical protein
MRLEISSFIIIFLMNTYAVLDLRAATPINAAAKPLNINKIDDGSGVAVTDTEADAGVCTSKFEGSE